MNPFIDEFMLTLTFVDLSVELGFLDIPRMEDGMLRVSAIPPTIPRQSFNALPLVFQ